MTVTRDSIYKFIANHLERNSNPGEAYSAALEEFRGPKADETLGVLGSAAFADFYTRIRDDVKRDFFAGRIPGEEPEEEENSGRAPLIQRAQPRALPIKAIQDGFLDLSWHVDAKIGLKVLRAWLPEDFFAHAKYLRDYGRATAKTCNERADLMEEVGERFRKVKVKTFGQAYQKDEKIRAMIREIEKKG